MKARLHLLTGPAGSGKTSLLLERFRRAAARPGSALWVCPTQAARTQVREKFLAGGELAGFRIWTFQEILAEAGPSNRALTPAQRRLLLDEIVAELQASGQLRRYDRVSETRGFLEGLEGLIDELQAAGVRPIDFARAAYRKGFEGKEAGRSFRRRSIADKDRQCARICARYRRELRRLGLLDAAAWELSALEQLRSRAGPLSGVEFVALDSFVDFTPGQYALLQALADVVSEIWITLPDEEGEARAELFTRARATRQRLAALFGERLSIQITGSPLPGRPAGLAHLERQLFRPLRQVEVSSQCDGLFFLEAPGVLGEARLVARHVKELLLAGTAPEQISIVLRDLDPHAALLREVFEEYGLPIELEGTDPLLRSPAVAVLLRALRLAEDDWPFAGVTALLRHTFFRPAWPEVTSPDLPGRAEVLLRLLGEPRGRDAYLAAVERRAERQQEGLEDEQAEESRRRRTHELAKLCRAFLNRFFRAWDGAPGRAPLATHVAWLKKFAADLGLVRAAEEAEAGRAALTCLWGELHRWQERPQERLLDRRTFLRRLSALAAEAGIPRSQNSGFGRVRLLSATLGRHLECDYVYIMGLGERSFPRARSESSLLDESERQSLAGGGLELPAQADSLPAEMLLFYQVITRARRQVILSFPGVDERGQEMLPSSFLLAVRDCFHEASLERCTQRRRMLIEGLGEDRPLSAAEYRVRVAANWLSGAPGADSLPEKVRANLADASEMALARLRAKEYTTYDGSFRDAKVIDSVARQFGPERVFSPTALENYVSCPFRFLLEHALRLEPLEEPREEIEVTRRGMAFHRGLARLHRQLKQEGVHGPEEEVHERVLREIASAVDEDVLRAPSPATKELWRLEGLRLLKLAARYRGHWQKFLKPWQERGVAPRPHFFEIDFGLPVPEGEKPYPPLLLRSGDVEVRVSGRIDRVDLADLEGGVGFWIIDYKTGRGSNYTAADLAEFRKLQLTLYAHAVEVVLLDGQRARPLGLAYWLVGEGGPKVVLPGRKVVEWLDEAGKWPQMKDRLTEWVTTLVRHIREGAFPLAPRSEHCTQTCPYAQVCRINQARGLEKGGRLPLPGGG